MHIRPAKIATRNKKQCEPPKLPSAPPQPSHAFATRSCWSRASFFITAAGLCFTVLLIFVLFSDTLKKQEKGERHDIVDVHTAALCALPVFKRFQDRLYDEDCPWDETRAWARSSRQALEAAKKAGNPRGTAVEGLPPLPPDAILYVNYQDGPGFGTALMYEAATLLVGILLGLPVYHVQCNDVGITEGGKTPGFNAAGDLLISQELGGLGGGYYMNSTSCRPLYMGEDFFRKGTDIDQIKFPVPILANEDHVQPAIKALLNGNLSPNLTFSLDSHIPWRVGGSAMVVAAGSMTSSALPFFPGIILYDSKYADRAKKLGSQLSDTSAVKCPLRLLIDTPGPPVAKLLTTALASMPKSALLVAIHIRRGDGIMAQECGRGADGCVGTQQGFDNDERVHDDSVMAMLKAAKRQIVAKIRARREVNVFIASDTASMLELAKTIFPGDVLWVDGVAHHTTQGGKANYAKIAADFFGMAMADVCIRSRSAFGGSAMELGGCIDFTYEHNEYWWSPGLGRTDEPLNPTNLEKLIALR